MPRDHATPRPRPGASTTPGSRGTARERAFQVLSAHAGTFPEIQTPRIDDAGLDPRDAALSHAIVDAVAHRWLTLEHLLNRFGKTPLREMEPAMRAVLLGGAAQLAFFDRVPAYSVIDTAVDWAKSAVRPGAGGMVNAVLRRLADLLRPGDRPARRPEWTQQRDEIPLSDGTALALTSEALPSPITTRVAIATSHPEWLVRRWVEQLGSDTAFAVARHDLADPPVVLNTAHAREPLPGAPISGSEPGMESGPGVIPHARLGSHIAVGPIAWLTELLQRRDDIWVQDAASVEAVRSVSDLRPRLVADLCAGRGTKSRQLAAAFPDAEIWATDPDPERFSTLQRVFCSSPRVRVCDRAALNAAIGGKTDLVLLDVPCSNTGVLARRPQAKYRCGTEQLARLTAIQRSIVTGSLPLLAPGGSILYSTCSLERDENEGIVDDQARRHGLGVSRQRLTMPNGAPGGPGVNYHDGAFSALLTRGAGGSRRGA